MISVYEINTTFAPATAVCVFALSVALGAALGRLGAVLTGPVPRVPDEETQ